MIRPLRRAASVCVAVIVSVAALGLCIAPAAAKTVPISGHSQTAVKNGCSGTFWTQGSTGHTYGCLNEDGSGIVCGGVTPAQKKTCDTFRTVGQKFHFPTRDDIARTAKG